MSGRTRPPPSVSAGLATHGLVGGPVTDHAAAVLAVVERIPAGKVMTYKDVAEYVGFGSGRTVGAVMSRYGHEVPWHRVVLSTGAPNPSSPDEGLRLLVADGTPLVRGGGRVDLAAARWDGR